MHLLSPSPRRCRVAAVCGALVLSATAAAAQSPRGDLLVSPEWLAGRLNDPNLVLLHVGNAAEYARAHIPGARLVNQEDLSTSHAQGPPMLQMLPAAALKERLERLGIGDDSRIVVYYGNDWVSPATRVVFTLDHAGLGGRTSLLDGGMRAWRDAGNAVTDAAMPARRGTLSALRTRDNVVDAAWVRAHLNAPRTLVVDGRAAAFYDGVDATGDRHGHIPGARTIPFTEITDARLRVRPAAELAALFHAAGARPGDTIVGYCHIGQQATAMLFAARTLGYDVKLYDGSFEEWGGRADLPVENAPRGGRR